MILIMAALAVLPSCSDDAAPAAGGLVAAAYFDGPGLRHPREQLTAGILFDGPIATRARRLEQLALGGASLRSSLLADALEQEMRNAGTDLDGVAAETVATFSSGRFGSDGRWLLTSIGPDTAAARVLVVFGPRDATDRDGVGSSALELTVFLESLRLCTLARATAEQPCSAVAIDFVLVLGGPDDFGFMTELPQRDGVCVGVLTIAGMSPAHPEARELVARVDRAESVLARSLAGVLADFSGQSPAWGRVGLEVGLVEIPAASYPGQGQERLPRVELRGARGADGEELNSPKGLAANLDLRRIQPQHGDVGGELDRVDHLAGPRFPLVLAAARALTMAILRCEAAFASR